MPLKLTASRTKKFAVFELPSQLENLNLQMKSEDSTEKATTKESTQSSSVTNEKPATSAPVSTAVSVTGPPVKQAPKAFTRRDHLREIEIQIQSQWNETKVYESNVDINKPKFFLNFPYPYMNGRLHLGHAFSLTKAEFTARFQRLQGKNVLFPFAFHCTGMPIQAAANKLRDEMIKFGNPPIFPVEKVAEEETATSTDDPTSTTSASTTTPPATQSAEAAIAAKSKGKKSKLIVKGQAGSAPMRQWDIMRYVVLVLVS